jgi:hypothetical protein
LLQKGSGFTPGPFSFRVQAKRREFARNSMKNSTVLPYRVFLFLLYPISTTGMVELREIQDVAVFSFSEG